jgi:hypothetical protein
MLKAKGVDGGRKKRQGARAHPRGKATLHSATYRIGREGFGAADRKKFLALLERAIDTEGRSFEIIITGDRMSFALGPREGASERADVQAVAKWLRSSGRAPNVGRK